MAREPQTIVVVETWAGQGSPRRAYTEASHTYSDAIVAAKKRMAVVRDAQYARLYMWGYDREKRPELHSRKTVMANG